MELLTKPSHVNFEKEKELTDFGYFTLFPTERNWVGENYVVKDQANDFLMELIETKEEFKSIFTNIEKLQNISLLVDVSVFSEKKDENEKILEFLEELEDFSIGKEIRAENEIKSKKYLKKLRSLATKIENHGYLYRWYFSNKSHVFANELIEVINTTRKEYASKVVRNVDKGMDNISLEVKRQIKKGSITKDGYKELQEELFQKMVHNYKEEIRKTFQQHLKYSFSEPSLLFFSMFGIMSYIMDLNNTRKELEIETLISNKAFIYIEIPKRKIEVHYKDFYASWYTESMEKAEDDFLLQFETYLPHLFKETGDSAALPRSLYHLKNNENKDEREKIEILKTITNWASERITKKAKIHSHLSWLNHIQSPFFNDIGIYKMGFLNQEIIAGENGEELNILAVGVIENNQGVYFPVFNPKSWDGLNSKQCALMTYAVCLYHDMLNEENYSLVLEREASKNKRALYKLVLHSQGYSDSSKQLTSSTSNSKKQKTKESTMVEHWVSFHFRKLKEGYSASEEAKEAAKKYGIKQIPRGFTFVSPFQKGGIKTDPSKAKISAVNVLNKTLNKLEHLTDGKVHE